MAQLKKFKVEIPQPPEIRLSDSIQSFTLLNRSLTPEHVNYKEDSLQIDFYKSQFDTTMIVLDSLVSDTLLQVLGELLFESQRYDIVIPYNRNIPRLEYFNDTPETLEWDYVSKVCDDFNTDALLVLENFATRVVTNYESGFDYSYSYGQKSYYASIDFYYRAHWRIYDPVKKEIIVDYISSEDTLYWDNYEYSLVDCFKGLPSIKDAGIETAIKVAFDFSDKISPVWKEDSRYYYVTKDDDVDKSIPLASEGNWYGALENWLKYVDTGSKSNRSKVMLNVALGYEMTGNLDEAINWAKNSMDTYYREVSNYYLNELTKLKKQLKK